MIIMPNEDEEEIRDEPESDWFSAWKDLEKWIGDKEKIKRNEIPRKATLAGNTITYHNIYGSDIRCDSDNEL